MPREITYSQAINEALELEMGHDETVVLFGEDIAGGTGAPGEDDAWGGVFAVTSGLQAKYPERIFDTPISEAAIVGAAAGAAISGLKPVVEVMFSDFMTLCADQIINQAAKFRYMFGGKVDTPIVVRTAYGTGEQAAAQHSQTTYGMFVGIPGLKVVTPATPYDAKGLLAAAIQDPDPVLVYEHKMLYDQLRGEVPAERYLLPFGEADVAREGADVTIVAIGRMRHRALEAAATLAEEGVECEVIDPRTLSPLDEDTIFDSVENTGRLVVVDEAPPGCSVARDIVARVAGACFAELRSAPATVTAPHAPVAFSPLLETLYTPAADQVLEAVRGVLDQSASGAR
jgi:acetoin:2,6-dichlorophenolindophenol oxidoreductase subunit beta